MSDKPKTSIPASDLPPIGTAVEIPGHPGTCAFVFNHVAHVTWWSESGVMNQVFCTTRDINTMNLLAERDSLPPGP